MAKKEQAILNNILNDNKESAPGVFLPVLTLVFLVLSFLGSVSPQLRALWILDRNALGQGEFWRIFSCHLVHFSPTHLFYNLLVFACAGWLVEKQNRLLFLLFYMLTAGAVSATLLWRYPNMGYYGGLSGVTCGFLLYSAFLLREHSGPWQRAGWLLLIALPLKVGLEFWHQGSILPYPDKQDFITMPLSHLAGMAAAIACFAVSWFRSLPVKVCRSLGRVR
ncbi:MAG: rhombosortase [Candidatus Electrothrix aestuarii]|uniref:Rhombosortase n=1 Tax=Candidatus Electrothrix aestuarii TaxID=3062594 RepID=A0AAU8LTI4_9BACT|nr:rhombosortase [Candidatus Electrothrix aestuarii]